MADLLGGPSVVILPLQPCMERVLITTPASLTLASLPPQLAVDGCASAQDATVAACPPPFGPEYGLGQLPSSAVSSPDGRLITGQCVLLDRCYLLRVEAQSASPKTTPTPHSLTLTIIEPPVPPGAQTREVRGMGFSSSSSHLAVTSHFEGPGGLRTQVLLLDAQAMEAAKSALFEWGNEEQWNLQAGFQWSPKVGLACSAQLPLRCLPMVLARCLLCQPAAGV